MRNTEVTEIVTQAVPRASTIRAGDTKRRHVGGSVLWSWDQGPLSLVTQELVKGAQRAGTRASEERVLAY